MLTDGRTDERTNGRKLECLCLPAKAGAKKHILCPSLEPSHQDRSNEGSQHMFSWRNKKNYRRIIFNTPSYQELCSGNIKIEKKIYSPVNLKRAANKRRSPGRPVLSWLRAGLLL